MKLAPSTIRLRASRARTTIRVRRAALAPLKGWSIAAVASAGGLCVSGPAALAGATAGVLTGCALVFGLSATERDFPSSGEPLLAFAVYRGAPSAEPPPPQPPPPQVEKVAEKPPATPIAPEVEAPIMAAAKLLPLTEVPLPAAAAPAARATFPANAIAFAAAVPPGPSSPPAAGHAADTNPPPSGLDAPSREGAGGRDNALAGYWDRVQRQIAARLAYPHAARQRGIEGAVELRIDLDFKGQVKDMVPVSPSADRVLTEAVMRAIRATAPFGAVSSDESTAAENVSTTMRFRFELVTQTQSKQGGDRL